MDAQDHYSALVEWSDDGIVAKDLEGRVISWNPAAERIFGYSAEEIVGQSIRRLLPPGKDSEEDDILARISRGERVGQFITQRVHKSGQIVDVSITISPVRDRNGKIVGASKIARDAGPFLAHQRQLRESEERFRLLAENITHFAWIARADGHIEWYNQRWFDYTGTTLEEMEGWGWTKVHHPDHVERVKARIQHSWDTGEPWEDIFPLRAADGEYRWFLSRARPIRDEIGNIRQWFGTNTDITEQREQAEQIRLLLHEVNHRSKNMLSMVQAIARRTGSENGAFLDTFESRVAGLAANQDILVRREWREVPLGELVQSQLGFLNDLEHQFDIQGADCALQPRVAEIVGMAIHELATNSLKYGALSTPDGKVAINWEPKGKDGFRLRWEESGGPVVTPPERTGFGTSIIRDVPARMLSGTVKLDYLPEGVVWEINADEGLAHASRADAERREIQPLAG